MVTLPGAVLTAAAIAVLTAQVYLQLLSQLGQQVTGIARAELPGVLERVKAAAASTVPYDNLVRGRRHGLVRLALYGDARRWRYHLSTLSSAVRHERLALLLHAGDSNAMNRECAAK
jgi:hypothetical protein